jgi:hypothetical protein
MSITDTPPDMTWEHNDGEFAVKLWETSPVLYAGKTRWHYQFIHTPTPRKGEIVFEGDDFHSSPMHNNWDTDFKQQMEIITSLLGFLSLQEGDTDKEYFKDYTPRQIEWRDEFAEDLSLAALEFRESFETPEDE